MTKVKSSFLQIFKKSRIANYVNSTIKFCELLTFHTLSLHLVAKLKGYSWLVVKVLAASLAG
jgi:hypothetical protein